MSYQSTDVWVPVVVGSLPVFSEARASRQECVNRIPVIEGWFKGTAHEGKEIKIVRYVAAED